MYAWTESLAGAVADRAGPALSMWACLAATACTPGAQPAQDPNTPLPLPFVVSDYFAATGAEGDGTITGALTDNIDVCPDRVPGALGDCYQIVYEVPQSSVGWAALVWQYPQNNWGNNPGYPGQKVAPGATALTFATKTDTQLVEGRPLACTFGVGGVNYRAGPYGDKFKTSGVVTYSDAGWQSVSIPLTTDSIGLPLDYSRGVIGGFSWQAGSLTDPKTGMTLFTVTPGDRIVVYVDNIQWQ
jgi:hypothetical protein